MTRKAILLSSSSENATEPNVSTDSDAFASFLRSGHGGAWEQAEIVKKRNPTKEQVLTVIGEAKGLDYTLLYFSGPGEFAKMGLPWLEMRVGLSSGEAISERELNAGSPRCTFFFDCSRPAPSPAQERPQDSRAASSEPGANRASFCKAYCDSLMAAEGGLVKVYAVFDRNNALPSVSFTRVLLEQATAWTTTVKGVLPMGAAVALANDAMRNQGAGQQAEYRPGRRLNDFPFAV